MNIMIHLGISLNSPAVFGKTLELRTHKVFLQFLYP